MSKERGSRNSRGGEPCEQGVEAGLKTAGGGMGRGQEACRPGAVVHCIPAALGRGFLQERPQICDSRAASPAEPVLVTISLVLAPICQLSATSWDPWALNIISFNRSSQKAKMKMQTYQPPRGYVTCPRSPSRAESLGNHSILLGRALRSSWKKSSRRTVPSTCVLSGPDRVETDYRNADSNGLVLDARTQAAAGAQGGSESAWQSHPTGSITFCAS